MLKFISNFQSVEIILGVDGSVIRVFGVIYWRDSLQAVRTILQVCGRISLYLRPTIIVE